MYKINRQSEQIVKLEEEIKAIKASESRGDEKNVRKQVGKFNKERSKEGQRWKEPIDWNGVWRIGRSES